MKKEQLAKIEDILKVLEKANFDNIKLTDALNISDRVRIFAMTLKELKEELEKPVKVSKKSGIKEKKDVKPS